MFNSSSLWDLCNAGEKNQNTQCQTTQTGGEIPHKEHPVRIESETIKPVTAGTTAPAPPHTQNNFQLYQAN